jgi:hypothetical protein
MPDHIPIASSPALPVAPPLRPARRTPVSLWDEVLRARIDMADERASPGGHRQPSARSALVMALDAYVMSLTERGHPVPYALRDELRLQRLTCTNRYDGELIPVKDRPGFGR